MKILFCICTALSMFFSVWAVIGQIKLRKMRDRLNELECSQYPQQKSLASEEHRCKGYPFVDNSMVFHFCIFFTDILLFAALLIMLCV